MSFKYDLVIFDVDGTILDTTEGVVAAVKHTIQIFGLDMPEEDQLFQFIGPPIQDSFRKVYGLEGDILQELATVFRNQYKDVDLLKASPYPGIYEVFQGLKDAGIQSAIATYKREDYAKTLLNHFGFNRYTDIIYGGDHFNQLKKSDIIDKCIRDSGVKDKKRIVMVGDTDNDAIGAERIGVDFVAVTYGFGFKTEKDLKSLKYVECLEQPVDLLNFLQIK